ncbi:MAG: hypothetical protein U1E78_10010 [Gammaproteobacteria bacterium]
MLKKISELCGFLSYSVRFNIISKNWQPAHIADLNNRNRFIRGLLQRTWVPTNVADMSGNNTFKGLNDNTLAYDLPFLLARNSGIQSLDLSKNDLGEATLRRIRQSLPSTKITILKLSGHQFNEAAKSRLPQLIECKNLETLELINCNLEEQDISALITVLNRNTSLRNLNISDNQATEAQLTQINRILSRNNSYHHYQNTFQKENILDLQRCTLDKEQLEDLAFYIQRQKPFFFQSASLKEIKMPMLEADLKDKDFASLIEALKANNRITSLTMCYEGVSDSVEQQIRTQLMLNKARTKILDKPGSLLGNSLNYLFKSEILVLPLLALVPALPFIPVLLGVIALRFASQAYFSRELNNAKTLDLTQPENTAAIKLGKEAAHSWLAYLNPKAYTPMAYLGYTIERDNLSAKYGVEAECFKPVVSKAKI